MNYEQVAPKMGKWAKYWRKFIESEDMNELFSHLKKRSASGVKILPSSDKVFRCFTETDPDKLKCIICGIAPYHTTYGKDKDKVDIADGLALSCSSTWKQKGLQPSLEQIYWSWEKDYNETIDADMIVSGDLQYLAQQGVLLYNVGLTVEENKPLSMNAIWEKFNTYMWEEVINQWFRGIPVIFMGTQSHKSANLLTPMLHYPICVSHPASASYQGGDTKWSSEGCWKKVDKVLMENNGEKIEWYQTKKAIAPWDEPNQLPSLGRSIDREYNEAYKGEMPWE